MANNFCTVCGTGVSEDKKCCTACGAPVQQSDVKGRSKPLAYAETATCSIPSVQIAPTVPAMQQAYQPQQQPSIKPIIQADFIPSNKSKYEPISTRGYLGICLLMLIPILNLLLLIVWACGGCRKISKRNYARSMIIVGTIAIILGVILTIVFKSSFYRYIAPIIAPYGLN